MQVYLVNIGDFNDTNFWSQTVVCRDFNSVVDYVEFARDDVKDTGYDLDDLLAELEMKGSCAAVDDSYTFSVHISKVI